MKIVKINFFLQNTNLSMKLELAMVPLERTLNEISKCVY